MDAICPCREVVSERFPVASFAVTIRPRRYFEVVCATDPMLFHTDHAPRRTRSNFYASSRDGLLRAGSSTSVYMVPPEVLRRFAGAERLYYALGTYGDIQGVDPSFTISPRTLAQSPCIRLSPDFTGRAIDARRLGAVSDGDSYGSPCQETLRWGGDRVLAAERARVGEVSAPARSPRYDDGYGDPEADHVSPPEDAAPPPGQAAVAADDRAASAADYAYDGDAAFGLDDADDGYEGRYGRPVYQAQDREESLAVGPAARPLGATVQTNRARSLDVSALDVAEKVRIVRVVASVSGGGYTNAEADPDLGLLFGLLLFPQKTGAIGRVLQLSLEREEKAERTGARLRDALTKVLGDSVAALARQLGGSDDTTADRMNPFEGAPLWQEPWLGRFKQAGALPHVQAAQNEVAVRDFFDPMLPIAAGLGLQTARELAVLTLLASHRGVGGARAWVMRVAGPIRSEAERDAALRALGHGEQGLAEFQQVRGLKPDGRWGPLSHAALARAVRALGAASPVRVTSSAEVMRTLSERAEAEGFAEPMRSLLQNAGDFDDAISFDVG